MNAIAYYFYLFSSFFFFNTNRMTQSHAYTKRAKWDFLRQLMQNWAEMVESEQSFLVEV